MLRRTRITETKLFAPLPVGDLSPAYVPYAPDPSIDPSEATSHP